jgi:hypothetical protein
MSYLTEKEEKMNVPAEWLIKPGETELRGFWIDLGSRMEKDTDWQRIEWLTTERFEEVVKAENGLDVLYRDPSDGRLWEKVHDHPALRDGGPPRLSVIDRNLAVERYQLPL